MKFHDVILAVATLGVINLLLDSVLLKVFVPMISPGGTDVAGILSILAASLIVGYLFAVKIQEESRRGAVGNIAVLFAAVLMLIVISLLSSPLTSPAIQEALESEFSTSGWTNYDWFVAAVGMWALNVVFALMVSFIGVYAGSLLRKSKKA